MALSPLEVERRQRDGGTLSAREKQVADNLEMLIDINLPAIYKRDHVARPAFPRFVSRRIVEELGRRYSRKGWHIDIDPPLPESPGYKLSLTARRTRWKRLVPRSVL